MLLPFRVRSTRMVYDSQIIGEQSTCMADQANLSTAVSKYHRFTWSGVLWVAGRTGIEPTGY